MMTTLPTISTLSVANVLNQTGASNLLPAFPHQSVVDKTIEALQRCYSTPLPSFSHSSPNNGTIFFGVDWTKLGKEVAALGFIRSIPKILRVFYDILVRFPKVLTFPLTEIENFIPGLLSFAQPLAVKFAEVENELISQQARLHQAKIKYLVASQELPFTLETCRHVFDEAYSPEDPEYRVLCEGSLKEIYTPYLLNHNYLVVMFALSYTERMGDFIPFLKLCAPNREKVIEEDERKGKLSTQFSEINFSQLSGSEVIDLFKEKLGTPYTMALAKQTIEYEEKLRCYNQIILDDETKFTNLCFAIARHTSFKIHKDIRQWI